MTLWLLGLVTTMSFATDWFLPFDPSALSGDPLERPSRTHLLGTNNIGQDLFSQLVSGARTSLVIAIIAASLATTIALAFALAVEWSPPGVERFASMILTALIAVPRLPLLILLGTYVGGSTVSSAVIIAIAFWPVSARVLQSRFTGIRNAGYIRAAVGFGARSPYVMTRHVVPEIVPITIASAALTASRAVMIESGLALLGIGDVTRISWGTTIRQALDFSSLFRIDAWRWWLVPPVLAVSAVTILLAVGAEAIERRVLLRPNLQPRKRQRLRVAP